MKPFSQLVQHDIEEKGLAELYRILCETQTSFKQAIKKLVEAQMYADTPTQEIEYCLSILLRKVWVSVREILEFFTREYIVIPEMIFEHLHSFRDPQIADIIIKHFSRGDDFRFEILEHIEGKKIKVVKSYTFSHPYDGSEILKFLQELKNIWANFQKKGKIIFFRTKILHHWEQNPPSIIWKYLKKETQKLVKNIEDLQKELFLWIEDKVIEKLNSWEKKVTIKWIPQKNWKKVENAGSYEFLFDFSLSKIKFLVCLRESQKLRELFIKICQDEWVENFDIEVI